MLSELEQVMHRYRKKDILVYAVANNGFFEGNQNHIAFDILKNWCIRAGLSYGQGIAQGAGEMMPFIKNIPLGYGPLKNLGNAFTKLAQNIKNRKCAPDILFSPNWPRFAWRYMATHKFWHPHAKKNGLKIHEIKTHP
jgi:hypothetical protein